MISGGSRAPSPGSSLSRKNSFVSSLFKKSDQGSGCVVPVDVQNGGCQGRKKSGGGGGGGVTPINSGSLKDDTNDGWF